MTIALLCYNCNPFGYMLSIMYTDVIMICVHFQRRSCNIVDTYIIMMYIIISYDQYNCDPSGCLRASTHGRTAVRLMSTYLKLTELG